MVCYHIILMHAGEKKLWETIQLNFKHPKLWHIIKAVVQKYQDCQNINLNSTQKYGQIPTKQIIKNP